MHENRKSFSDLCVEVELAFDDNVSALRLLRVALRCESAYLLFAAARRVRFILYLIREMYVDIRNLEIFLQSK